MTISNRCAGLLLWFFTSLFQRKDQLLVYRSRSTYSMEHGIV